MAYLFALWMLKPAPAAAQVNALQTAPPGARTGMIAGQVIDAGTGAPIPEAVVRLSMPKYSEAVPTTPRGRVMADAQGRFFFSELPPGEYFLQAAKDGYAPASYGQRRAWGQDLRLSLAEGERLTGVQLRAWKYGVIAGTVTDEAGEPVVGVAVRAFVKTLAGGAARFGSQEIIPELEPAATTDDRGMFRLAQLSPGTYVVAVPATQTTLPAASLLEVDPAMRSELFFSGVGDIALLGQPRTQQAGDVALMTSAPVAIPPPPAASGRMAMYKTTFYPAASTAAAAMPIAIGPGEERTDIAISIRPVPAYRVSGRLIAPDGSAPPPTTIELTAESLGDVITSIAPSSTSAVGLQTVTGMSDASGRFTLLGVPAGDYVLRQANRFLSRTARQGTAGYWISQRVTVGREDVRDLAVELRPAFRVEGRIEAHAADPASLKTPVIVLLLAFETPFGEPGRFVVEARFPATSTFETVGAGGRYVADVATLNGWVVESIIAGGTDITDRPFDLQSDLTSMVITVTDRASKVTGRVVDANGTPSTTAVVLAFPVVRERWSGYGPSPRLLKSALADRNGNYTFAHLPPADYYLAAIDAGEMDGWMDPSRLASLAEQASTLTIRPGEPVKPVDLRLRAKQ